MIWLIDRSRVVDGRGTCERLRLLGYHIGPTGYGIAKKAQKLPLVTGILAHASFHPILAWCKDHDDEIVQALALPEAFQEGVTLQIVPDSVVRGAIGDAITAYRQTVAARGFAYLEATDEVQQLTAEQEDLVSGLVWAWTLEVLPEILRRAAIVEVEHDDAFVFDCTCGLGEGIGSLADHEARGCEGKALQCRPDFLALTRQTAELEYHEFKTTGQDGPSFRDKWEVMLQMLSATVDAERRHEKRVGSIYVHGLIKGKREGEYNPITGKKDGMKRQSSVCCYGYRKPAVPPMEAEEWEPSYEWFDDFEQRVKRVGKAFKRTSIRQVPGVPADMTASEYWMKWIPSAARKKCLVLLGPFTRQDQMVEGFWEETRGEEARWQAGLWELYDLAQTILAEHEEGADYWAVVWPDQRFQSAMNRLFPRSYECRQYGFGYRCQMEDLCFYREGWDYPLGNADGAQAMFIYRRPHHRDELQQAIDRGLLPPDEGLAEDADEAEAF